MSYPDTDPAGMPVRMYWFGDLAWDAGVDNTRALPLRDQVLVLEALRPTTSGDDAKKFWERVTKNSAEKHTGTSKVDNPSSTSDKNWIAGRLASYIRK